MTGIQDQLCSFMGEYGFHYIDSLKHNGLELSSVYLQRRTSTIVIIDHPSIFETSFKYKLYCKQQNELMAEYPRVLRFVQGQQEIGQYLGSDNLHEKSPGYLANTFNRTEHSIDPTPVEFLFEECFIQAYGSESVKYLQREYPFFTDTNSTVFMDYTLFNLNGTWVGIEENGISYHHPGIIGETRYKNILAKQNAVSLSNGKVFRWDTESLGNQEQVVDELKDFLGPINQYVVQSSIMGTRSFTLHDYQIEHLQNLALDRAQGKNAALVVLPTGTGKTSIAIEDMICFLNSAGHTGKPMLIMVPSRDLVDQWQKILSAKQSGLELVQVKTYAAVSRTYFAQKSNEYDYIVVDEAHHAAAPVMKKILAHFQPVFLLGLTATDKRLDQQKLEDIFSQYQEQLDLKQAIKKGHLAQIRALRLKSNIDLSQVRFNGKDYFNSQLERTIRVSSRNELIADTLHTYFFQRLSGKQGIVFCVSIEHAKDMARIIQEKGMTAQAVDGKDSLRFEKIKAYQNGKIQFLCTCSLLTEGWDSPQTSIIVMARPTLSRVLYTQQLGRGTRNHPGKEALYVIDVVDTYGSFGTVSNRPWSIHSLFELQMYTPFGNLITRPGDSSSELIELDTIYEKEMKLEPFDLFTFQQDYGDYLSPELLARALFVSTGTVLAWIRKGEIPPDISIPMGRSTLHYVHPDRIPEIRIQKQLKEHTQETLVADFWDFINEATYTFSYKIFFLLSLLDLVDGTGEVSVKDLVLKYRSYYEDRIRRNLPVDRKNCPYGEQHNLESDSFLTRSLLENPFEKFERKRFMYHCKDLSRIALNHILWAVLKIPTEQQRLREIIEKHRQEYFENLGGV